MRNPPIKSGLLRPLPASQARRLGPRNDGKIKHVIARPRSGRGNPDSHFQVQWVYTFKVELKKMRTNNFSINHYWMSWCKFPRLEHQPKFIEIEKNDAHLRKAIIISTFWISGIFGFAIAGRVIPHFDDLDYVGRQSVAAIGLVGIAAVLGFLASVLHFGINRWRGVKNRSDYSVHVGNIDDDSDDIEVELSNLNTSINENMGLMGRHQNASIYRLGNCHPLHIIYPATPMKTGFWISIVALAVFGIVSMIKLDLFNEFAGNRSIINSTLTNCTTMLNSTGPNNTTCVSVLGYLIGVESSGLGFSLTLAGIAATLFHCAMRPKPFEYYRNNIEKSDSTFSFGYGATSRMN